MKIALLICTIFSMSFTYALPDNFNELTEVEKQAALEADILDNADVTTQEFSLNFFCHGQQLINSGTSCTVAEASMEMSGSPLEVGDTDSDTSSDLPTSTYQDY
jgi:hypothetical protein